MARSGNMATYLDVCDAKGRQGADAGSRDARGFQGRHFLQARLELSGGGRHREGSIQASGVDLGVEERMYLLRW
jgi:hypothetical protein